MRKILLTGRTGQLGLELQQALAPLGIVVSVDRSQMNLTSPDSIRRVIREVSPSIIVNAAGYTAVDKAEVESALAMQVNGTAPGVMAEEARRLGALLVHYSTDYVYDGAKGMPYVEDDAPNPLNAYGRTKLEGERTIAAAGCQHLILRTSWIYSATGTNFVLTMLRLAREKKELAIVDDQIGSPTSAKALALATAELLGKINGPLSEQGIFHLSATGNVSRLDFTRKIISIAHQLSGSAEGWATLRPTTTAQFPLPAARPLNAATSKEKIKRVFGIEMDRWEAQLTAFLQEIWPLRT